MVKSGEKWGDNMLIGEFQHNMDRKGRVIIPAKFREILGNEVVIAIGYDKNISIFTKEQFEQQATKLDKLIDLDPSVRRIQRRFYAKADFQEIDAQGRILLKESILKDTLLKKDCTVIGAYNHIEIWDKEAWEHYNQETEDNIDQLNENIMRLMK